MKRKSFTLIAAVLMMAAGVQTMWAQPGMVVVRNGKNVCYSVSEVQQVLFVDDISEYNDDYVDLDLPSGTLWATCNIGAENPEDYGNYYAWGETETKSDYSWGTYIHCSGTSDSMTKYCTYSAYGTVDDITTLLPEDDAATVNGGEDWHIPTNAQFNELLNSSYTTQEWTQQGGKDGWKITSISNGKSIFLPAAGRYEGTSCSSQGSMGYYWSSSLGSAGAYSSCDAFFYSGGIYTGSADRRYGMSIRPVRVETVHKWVDLGLPSGTLWATCNVGATMPEDYGNYFAWGETEQKYGYTWDTYKYCKGTNNTLTKYCCDSEYGYNGFTDDLDELLPEDDAATVNWGDEWQTPSTRQQDELLIYTTAVHTTQNGVNGMLITSKSNGNSIFLPSAGLYYTHYYPYNNWKRGEYMSRSLSPWTNSTTAWEIHFNDNGQCGSDFAEERAFGLSVRPVRKQ